MPVLLYFVPTGSVSCSPSLVDANELQIGINTGRQPVRILFPLSEAHRLEI